MACISKLARAIVYNCDSGATGLNSAIIINKADIASFSVDGTTMVVSVLTLAARGDGLLIIIALFKPVATLAIIRNCPCQFCYTSHN